MKKPILIVIDMLNDFFEGWEPERKQELVRSINELVALFRHFNLQIIWIRQEFEPDLSDAFPEMRAKGISRVIRGSEGCQILSDLAVDSADPVIIKKRYSAFFGTKLDELLARIQPDAIVLAGINTHACIRMTAIDAYQRDWKVILASDCIASYDSEHHESTLKYLKDKIVTLQSNQEIKAALKK